MPPPFPISETALAAGCTHGALSCVSVSANWPISGGRDSSFTSWLETVVRAKRATEVQTQITHILHVYFFIELVLGLDNVHDKVLDAPPRPTYQTAGILREGKTKTPMKKTTKKMKT